MCVCHNLFFALWLPKTSFLRFVGLSHGFQVIFVGMYGCARAMTACFSRTRPHILTPARFFPRFHSAYLSFYLSLSISLFLSTFLPLHLLFCLFFFVSPFSLPHAHSLFPALAYYLARFFWNSLSFSLILSRSHHSLTVGSSSCLSHTHTRIHTHTHTSTHTHIHIAVYQ